MRRMLLRLVIIALDSLIVYMPRHRPMQEYVPFQPYIEGPLLVVLHIAKTLPRYIAAAGTATAAGAAAAGPSPLSAVFGGLSAADAQAAARMIGDPGSLGKLKRDLFFRCDKGDLFFEAKSKRSRGGGVFSSGAKQRGLACSHCDHTHQLLTPLKTVALQTSV